MTPVSNTRHEWGARGDTRTYLGLNGGHGSTEAPHRNRCSDRRRAGGGARAGSARGAIAGGVERNPLLPSMVEALADDPLPHYGVSTGFGALATRHIPPALRADLQRSLIRSHAASSGDEVEREVVRAMMFLRLSTLATGRTGVHEATATTYGDCSTPGSRRSCGSTAHSAAPATSLRSRIARWL